MTTWADEYVTMLDDCEKRKDRLTRWDGLYVDALRHQIVESRCQPDQKQAEYLKSMWERATARG